MKDDKTETYLGDGLYASYDGYMITLFCERENGRHYVCLEPEVVDELVKYLRKVGRFEEVR